jgi:hypothetical protein
MGSNLALLQKIHEVRSIVIFIADAGEPAVWGTWRAISPGRISFRRTGNLIKEVVCRPLQALLLPGSIRPPGSPLPNLLYG